MRILSALPKHPNLVELLDARTPLPSASEARVYDGARRRPRGETAHPKPRNPLGADVFLVFERMPTDLEKVVNSNQFFTAEHVRWLTLDLLRAIRVLHGAGIVHRDLKPANMLLEVQPVRLKVCDFGLARTIPETRELRADDDRDRRPGDGAIAASPKSESDEAASPDGSRPALRRQLTQHVVTRWYRAPELLLRSPARPPGVARRFPGRSL